MGWQDGTPVEAPSGKQPAWMQGTPVDQTAPKPEMSGTDLAIWAAKTLVPGAAGLQIMHGLERAGTFAGEHVNDTTAPYIGEKPAAALGAAANAVVQLGPTTMGGGAAGKAAAPAMESVGKRVMQSVLKPTWADLRSGDAAKAITTMLDEGVNATRGGVDKLKSHIADLSGQVKNAISGSNGMVNSTPVSNGLFDLTKKVEAGTLGEADVKAIRGVWKELLDHPYFGGSDWMTVQEAQAMKQANYGKLGDAAYGLGLKPAAERDALKSVTSGLKDEIAKVVPEVAAPNQKMSELINAKDIAERRALMEGNKHPLSLGVSMGSVAHDPMAMLGLWANSSAYAKSIIARLLYSGAEEIPKNVGRVGGATLGSMLGRNEQRKQP